jgi:hypothetical protein
VAKLIQDLPVLDPQAVLKEGTLPFMRVYTSPDSGKRREHMKTPFSASQNDAHQRAH